MLKSVRKKEDRNPGLKNSLLHLDCGEEQKHRRQQEEKLHEQILKLIV